MKIKMRRNLAGLSARSTCLTLLALVLAATFTAPAFAFQFGSGDLTGSLDTTLSYGLAWRMDDQDPDIVGLSNGGNAFSVNGDDGNLNYDKGDLISNTAKITSEVALQYKNFGFFVRGSAFYDFENNDGDRARTPLSDDALDMVGTDVELLDAYITYDFNVASMPAQIRAGNQVISWGESTFIQNSINAINPIDASKYRVPGAELKEALIPVGIISASISPTDNISFEAFYQYEWEETAIDPPGSYWSTNDFAGEGGDKLMMGWGEVPDSTEIGSGGSMAASLGPAVPRASTVDADDDGQYGLAMRVYAPNLNDTEFGFYFMNYHSRVPIISANTGTLAGLAGGDYAASASYFTEYPEDIKLYGISFNTLLSGTGIALQGEWSYRQDMPLQVDDIELIYAAYSPVDPYVFGAAAGSPNPSDPKTLFGPEVFSKNQLGGYGFDETIHGYREMDVSQIQMTATKVFGPTFGADQFVLVGEIGLTHVHNMPSKEVLRFNGPATYVSGNDTPIDMLVPYPAPSLGDVAHNASGANPYLETKPIEPADAFADANSWGYRMIAKLDFNNAIGAVTLSPRVAWAHDVSGNSPGPGGNFVEDRRAVTLGLGANYLNQWTADLSYTDYFGAGRYNLVNDRDFVAFNIKYSF